MVTGSAEAPGPRYGKFTGQSRRESSAGADLYTDHAGGASGPEQERAGSGAAACVPPDLFGIAVGKDAPCGCSAGQAPVRPEGPVKDI